MKNILILSLVFMAFSCTTVENKEVSNTESSIITNFLEDVESLESIEGKNPITEFNEKASSVAKKKVSIYKRNIQKFLADAKEYKYCVIIVEDHTIVKIKDLEDCKQSGSWSACMPKVEGYIKKGKLVYKEDYLNNIIGLPDSQSRVAFLFN